MRLKYPKKLFMSYALWQVFKQLFPVLGWALAFDAAEDPVEIGQAVETAGKADFRNAVFFVGHKFFCFGNPS